jgi:phosphoribosylformylglycinamidine synthase
VLADVPAATLHEDAPLYHRPLARPADLDARRADDPAALPAPKDCGVDLLDLLVDPAWVYRQYDHQLFLNTVVAPGGDAALLRLTAPGVPSDRGPDEPPRAMALSTDGNGHWCALDPRLGTAMIVAESALNVACVGARPVAVVNCLNFGNPEHPEVMWQLSEAIDGMAEACTALGLPVIGGNVSLYNESRGRDIDPTPVVGTLGLVDALLRRPPGVALVDGQRIVEIRAPGTAPSLAGSQWAVKRHGHRGGMLAPLDLDAHRRLVDLVAALVGEGGFGGVHDVSGGGLGLAMAVQSGVGFHVAGVADHGALFGEAPSRVVLSVPPADVIALAARVAAAGLQLHELGTAGGDRIVVEGLVDVGLDDAVPAWRRTLPDALGLA